MFTLCNFPPDTETPWPRNNIQIPNNNIQILGSKYKKYYSEIKERLLKNGKVFIFGDPGMGKTTILHNLSKDLKSENYIPIYMDLSSDKSFVDEFWFFIKTSTVIDKLSNEIFNKRKEIGYTRLRWFMKDFPTWMKSECKKGVDNPFIRVYSLNFPDCKTYDGLDGIIKFLDDVNKIGLKMILLLDEAREEHYYPYIHKLINSGSVKLAAASPSEVLNSIKDEATIRRIRENSIILEQLKLDDAKEILSQMCKDIGENIAQEIYDNGMTIAELIIEAKQLYEELDYECKKDLECIKNKAKKFEIGDIQEKSRELEKIIRECIRKSKELLGIDRIFDTAKKVKGSTKNRNIDIVFTSRNKIFIGDVKLANSESLKDSSIENINDVVTTEQEIDGSKYNVGGVFIISNAKPLNFTGKTITISNLMVRRALRKNQCTEELRKYLEDQLKEIIMSR